MTNRINGDFEQDAIEAFRAAYAAQLSNPEDHEIDPINGLPTNVVHNTSPWIQHTGLWKANDGMSRDFKPNQPFNPDDYFPTNLESEGDDGNDDEVAEDTENTDTDAIYLTDEEFERLSEEIWGSRDGDSDGGAESDSDDNDNETQYEEDPYEESEVEGGELNEEEIDTLIDEILSERLEDDDEDSDSEVGGEYENKDEDDEDEEYNDKK